MKTRPSSATLEASPYIGPRPFELRHRDRFYGRDREKSEILSLIIANQTVVLYAESGTGKTSLLNAAVIPALQRDDHEVLPLTRVRGLIPENLSYARVSNPFVLNTLISWIEKNEAPAEALMNETIPNFLHQRERKLDEEGFEASRVIIFDQFEELFTAYPDRWQAREGFFTQIGQALEDDPLLHVVFSMREDFLAQLDRYARLLPGNLNTRYRLTRLRRSAALAAVTEPLKNFELVHRSYAPGVADKLVDDLLTTQMEVEPGKREEVLGESVEPVQLQVVCDSLWRHLPLDVRVISLENLREFGDVDQALSQFYEESIARAVDETLRDEDIPDLTEDQLRAWFEYTLITPNGTRGMVYQGVRETGGIDNRAVHYMENLHLIRAEPRQSGRWYELTHDRFIEPILKSNEAWKQRRAEAESRQRLEEERMERQRAMEAAEAEQKVREREFSRRIQRQRLGIGALVAVLAVMLGAAAFVNNLRNEANINAALAQAAQIQAQTQAGIANAESLSRATAQADAQNQASTAQAEANNRATAQADAQNQASTAQAESNSRATAQADAQNQAATAQVAATQEAIALAEAHRLATAQAEALNRASIAEAEAQAQAATAQVAQATSVALADEAALGRQRAEAAANDLFLARSSQLLSEGQIDLALLLSLEANQHSTAPEIVGSLAEGLQTNPSLSAYRHLHRGYMSGMAFSPDGRLLISSSYDKVVIVEEVATGEIIKRFTDSNHTLTSMALSADGKLLAAGGNGLIWLWDFETGELITRLIGHTDWIYALSFTPDSAGLASGGGDGIVLLWDLSNGSPIPVSDVESTIRTLAFNPKGTILAAGSWDNHVYLYTADGRELFSPEYEGDVNTLAFSPDGSTMAVGSNNIAIWDIESGETIVTFDGHTEWVYQVAFSPDGTRLASSSADGTVRLWDMVTYTPIGEPLVGHNAAVPALAFNPNGQTLASGGEDGTTILWDVPPTMRLGQSYFGHGTDVLSAVFSPDGSLLAAAGNGTVRLASPDAEVELLSLTDQLDWIRSMAYSPDGTYLASAGNEGTLVVRDMRTYQILHEINAHDGNDITSVDYSPDGRLIASGGYDNRVAVWNAETGEAVHNLAGHKNAVNAVAFHPDGEWLASAGDDQIFVWEVMTGREINRFDNVTYTRSLAFSPDGRLMAAGDAYGMIRMWRTDTWEMIGEPIPAHTLTVNSLDFSPDSTRLASGSDDKLVRLWNAADGTPIGEPLRSHVSRVYSVAFSPNGTRLLSAGSNGNVRLWNLVVEPIAVRALPLFIRGIYTVAYSDDGSVVASAGDDERIILWDMETRSSRGSMDANYDILTMDFSPTEPMVAVGGFNSDILLFDLNTMQQVGTLATGQINVRDLDFSPDGRWLVSGSDGAVVLLWDVADRAQVAQFEGHTGDISDVAFSPDGRWVASGAKDRFVMLWDATTHQLMHTFSDHTDEVYALAFSRDGTRLASAGRDESVKLWDVSSGDLITTLTGHSDTVFSLDFNAEGTLLASASGDDSVILWDINTTEMLQALNWHTGTVWAVRFSPDGHILSSGGADGQMVLWDVTPDDWKTFACRFIGRNLTFNEWQQNFEGREYTKVCPNNPVHRTVVEAKLDEIEMLLNAVDNETSNTEGQQVSASAAGANMLVQAPSDEMVGVENGYRQAAEWVMEIPDVWLKFRVCFAGAQHGFASVVAQACDQANAQISGDVSYYHNIASLFFDEGDYPSAMALYQTVLEQQPNGNTYFLLGETYRFQNNFSSAVESYSKALEFPLSQDLQLDIYVARSEIYGIIGDFNAARADLDSLAAIDPDNLDLLLRRAQFEMAQGNYENAVDDLTTIIDQVFDPYVNMMRMIALAKLGEREAAYDDYIVFINSIMQNEHFEPLLEAFSTRVLEMNYGAVFYLPFEGQEGDVISIDVTRPVGSNVDSLIVILDPNGNPVDGNDDSGGDFDASVSNVSLPTSGRYTLVVTHAGGATRGPIQVNLRVE